jgi:hypothetical protein
MVRAITLSFVLATISAICLPLRGGEPTCKADANNARCGAECPQCGCRLVPVCRIYCTTKKVTDYEYGCKCEEICIPGVTPLCGKRQVCDHSGACSGGSETCKTCCKTGRCKTREVRKMVKYPVTKEEPVKKCIVEWVCPNSDRHRNCSEGANQ